MGPCISTIQRHSHSKLLDFLCSRENLCGEVSSGWILIKFGLCMHTSYIFQMVTLSLKPHAISSAKVKSLLKRKLSQKSFEWCRYDSESLRCYHGNIPLTENSC